MGVPNASIRPAALGFPLLIVVGGVAAYSNSFFGVMVFDDYNAIVDNPNVRSLWPIWQAMWAPRYTTACGRPVLCLTLALNYAISGLEVWSYHLFNLAIHVLGGLTLFGILRRTLVTEALRGRLGGSAGRFALTVALLWTVHPLQTEAVTYISTRTESLMGLYLLLTLYCVIRGATWPGPRGWYLAAVAACGLGIGTKEVMVVAPLVVLLYDRTFLARSFGRALRQRGGLYGGLAATWAILAALAATGGRSESVGFQFEHLTPFDYAITQSAVILHYLRLSLWPHPLVLSYDDWPVARSLGSIWPQALVILSLLGGTLWALWRKAWIGFLGAWFFVILAPSSSILPIATEIAAERRMYLPLISIIVLVVLGVSGILGWAWRRLGLGERSRQGVAAGLLVVAAVAGTLGTVGRNADYHSAEGIWRDTLAKRPYSVKARLCLVPALYAQGRYAEGVELLRAVVRANRGGVGARYNLALGLTHQNRFAEAAVYYAEALKLNPNHVEARANYGAVLADLGRNAEALAQLEQAVQLEPKRSFTRVQLGGLYESEGKLEKAAEQYATALRLEPADAIAHLRLGRVLATQGRASEASERFLEAIRLQPDLADAHLDLAVVKMQTGELDQAWEHINEALRVQPNEAKPYFYRGMLRAMQGRTAEAVAAYRKAHALRPGWVPPANNLAWILATTADPSIRNPAEAVRLAEQVCQLGGEAHPGDLDTLAAAYAAADRFEEAVRTATQALELARKLGQEERAKSIGDRLAGYRQTRAYVEHAGP